MTVPAIQIKVMLDQLDGLIDQVSDVELRAKMLRRVLALRIGLSLDIETVRPEEQLRVREAVAS